ncbi:MAG: T9SS type A sorting domain-containing protein [bacterium]|nr:T9SS type A sorting domain-containing protein [bacterium]
MKKIVLTLLIVVCISMSASAQTATNTVDNFQITNGVTKFSFDIYTRRTSNPVYNMGNSSYAFTFTTGTLTNPVITYFNPRYKSGSPTGDYIDPMAIVPPTLPFLLLLQVNYSGLGAGTGDTVSSSLGITGLGEKIATIEMDILISNVQANFSWDPLTSEIVTPSFVPFITSTYAGGYNGLLPVELSSFVSNVNRNNVNLNWTTTSETNNNGFEIERKPMGQNSVWSKIGFVNGNGNSSEIRNYSFSDNGLNVGKYNYRLKQIDFNGNFEYFELGNEVSVGAPSTFEVSQNYPNPFNPSTKINFSIPQDSKVTLNIYDISGKLIMTLINNEFKSANYYTVSLNGSNLSSGTYFYTINAGDFNQTKKMILIK